MKIQLLTKEIIDHLPPLDSTDGIKLKDKIIVCKFFAEYSHIRVMPGYVQFCNTSN